MDGTVEVDLRSELRELNVRLNQLERAGHVGTWELALPAGHLQLSGWLMRTSGLGSDGPGEVSLEEFVHEACFRDEVRSSRGVVQDAIAERMPFTLVCRLRRVGTDDFSWVRFRGEPGLDARGEVTRFTGTATRIDHEIRAREEREVFQSTLQRVQRDESSSYLAGGLAHEVTNLLQPALLLCELAEAALRSGDEAKVVANLKSIRAAVERTAEVVRTTLDFSRLESDDLVPISVASSVEDLERFLDADLLRRIDLRVAPSVLARRFLATRAGVIQIVLNLLKNAALAAPDGSPISISVGLEPNELPEHEAIVFEFVDQGPGFSTEALARAFDPLFTTRSGSKGSGLGLAVVRTMIERWGGGVHVSNDLDGGARVVVRMPAVAEGR